MIMLSLGAGALAYLRGDAMPMMKRTQYEGQRTQWSELPHALTPRFLVDRTVLLDQIPAMLNGLVNDEPFKMSLALLGLEFTTPWITVADGNGLFLSHLELQLTAAGSSLASLRWSGVYQTEEPPAHIELRLRWDQSDEVGESPRRIGPVACAPPPELSLTPATAARSQADLSSALAVLVTVASLVLIGLCYTELRDHADTLAAAESEAATRLAASSRDVGAHRSGAGHASSAGGGVVGSTRRRCAAPGAAGGASTARHDRATWPRDGGGRSAWVDYG